MATVQKNDTEWQSPTEALTRFKPDNLTLGSDSAAPEHAKRYGFKVGNFGFILADREKAEITDQIAVCPIPNTPIWFNGMINVRGNLVPVFDLKKYLNINDEQQAERLLIIGQGIKAVSLLIDELPEVVEVNNIVTDMPPLPLILQTYTRKVYFHNQVIWLDLDYDEFFTELGARIVV
jgi:twitching motility protein PilI